MTRASKAGFTSDIRCWARRRRSRKSSGVRGRTRSPRGFRLEKLGGSCGDAEEEMVGARAAAEAAAVEWRKRRREMGVMTKKDGAGRELCQGGRRLTQRTQSSQRRKKKGSVRVKECKSEKVGE